MKDKKILLVSDLVGVGKVALSAQIPIINTMEADCSYLPTAVVSNNFNHGQSHMVDLTDFMEKTVQVWKNLGFEFDIIVTGILLNPRQVEIVKELIDYHKTKPLVITDPIMGDEGKLYEGLSPEIIEASRSAVQIADIIIPNLTEFSLIIRKDLPELMTHDLMVSWLNKAKARGVKSAVITSVELGDSHYVYGIKEDGEIFRVAYDYIPVSVGGSGDIFTALVIGKYSKNPDLEEATIYSSQMVTEIIRKEYEAGIEGRAKEVKIQNYLQDIYQSL